MDPTLIPLAAVCIPMVVVPTVVLTRHAHNRRLWLHQERMRALELGRPLPRSDAWAALTAVAIGLGVPFVSFTCAWMASTTARDHAALFPGATIVGLVGVCSGAGLGRRLISGRERPVGPPHIEPVGRKAAFDPDTFDVVGRRG